MDSTLLVPAFCPICDMIMKSSRSNWSYYEFGCCMNCHIEFVEGREERWKGGWRPDAAQVAAFHKKMGCRDP